MDFTSSGLNPCRVGGYPSAGWLAPASWQRNHEIRAGLGDVSQTGNFEDHFVFFFVRDAKTALVLLVKAKV